MSAEVTVASYNIHWGVAGRADGFRPFDVVEACRQIDADVLLLPESWAPFDGPSLHDEVAAALGLTVAAFAPLGQSSLTDRPRIRAKVAEVPRHLAATGIWGTALLTRAPATAIDIVPLPSTRLDRVDRAMIRAEVPVATRSLVVCGTHFAHYEHGSPLHRSQLRRALPDSTTAAVLLGDLNMWGWTVDLMTPPGWRRALKGKTFPSRRPRHQIDHLVVTASVEVLHSEVLPDLGSDHRPIRARLRLNA